MTKFETYPDPIFLLGILPRSGTNFMYDLLCLHPACQGGPIPEDYLLHHSARLRDYSQAVAGNWFPQWGVDDQEAVLFQHLGRGLVSFLTSQQNQDSASPKRLVTKTPGVRHLDKFFTLFPQAHLIILVRDGRAVIESGMRSFDWHFEAMTRSWANAARTILTFDQSRPDNDLNYMIIHYEKLVADTETELRKVFDFLELRTEIYDFEAALNAPVKGSSEARQGDKEVHWKPVKKTKQFNPTQRWSGWSRARHERFNWLAGHYLTQFGYEPQPFKGQQLFWNIWNRGLDVKWIVREIVRRLVGRA